MLSSLDLQHNELLDIPDSIGNLKSLTRLGLRFVNYSFLKQQILDSSKIKEFADDSLKYD